MKTLKREEIYANEYRDLNHLRENIAAFIDTYYERSRTHLSLAKDAPLRRPIQPSGLGRIVEIPQVGGLHHRYERIAA